MKFTATQIPYSDTGLFTTLIQDFIAGKAAALKYVQYPVSKEGVHAAIQERKKFPIQRSVLVNVLQSQYHDLFNSNDNTNITANVKVSEAIQSLLKENTFAITTAHQPNIFTGPLYFFYKIIHAIQLAADLKKQFPENNFVPVYYMGSEDADLDEVGSYFLGGTQHQWITKQKGAIGRMKVDDALLGLLQNLEGYWLVQPEGAETFNILKKAYQKGNTISEATLYMVHQFFGKYGLVVLQPDQPQLKQLFLPVMEQELLHQFSHAAIQPTLSLLAKEYHVQSEGRLLNLFYLKEDLRSRIEKNEEEYTIVDTSIRFTATQIIDELKNYPERFSPNVILRGVYQETILPSIVFIGGGGELAYWMELKNVFSQTKVHYPILQLRNSFVCIKEKQMTQWEALGFELKDLFKPILQLENEYIQRVSEENLTLSTHLANMNSLYQQIQLDVIKIDASLGDHTLNLSVQAQKKLATLEKKMLKAEKRKQHTALQRIHAIKNDLFPQNSLQERVENIAEWIGAYGWGWVDAIMTHSNTLAQNFTVLSATQNDKAK
jgi:bacillithiol biosynthesis cysteine-adding enzyme BshC